MQWGQIKTLFILSFLILNVYLFIQFLEKQKEADLGILESEESTIEEQLENENISIKSLPDELAKEPFISVRQKKFTEDEQKELDGFSDQKTVVIDQNVIVSLFNKPVPISKDESAETIESFVKESFIYPEAYEFWDWNKDLNILIFFQKENERPIYYNQNGMILIFLNEDDEMVFYTQTMLDDAESRQDKSSLIKPITAVEKLFNENELQYGDKVTTVNIGFHTRTPLTNGVQVFVPAWKVTVNDERDYFVNAIEGWVFSGDEIKFLEESIQLDIERIESISRPKSIKEKILELLNEKLATISRGEGE